MGSVYSRRLLLPERDSEGHRWGSEPVRDQIDARDGRGWIGLTFLVVSLPCQRLPRFPGRQLPQHRVPTKPERAEGCSDQGSTIETDSSDSLRYRADQCSLPIPACTPWAVQRCPCEMQALAKGRIRCGRTGPPIRPGENSEKALSVAWVPPSLALSWRSTAAA